VVGKKEGTSPTRNLLVPRTPQEASGDPLPQPAPAPLRRPWWLYGVIGLLALVVGISTWYLASSYLNDRTTDDGGPIVVPAIDAGIPAIPDAAPILADAGAVTADSGPAGAAEGAGPATEASAVPDAGISSAVDVDLVVPGADPGRIIVAIPKGYLSVETVPPSDIYLNGRKIGSDSISKLPVNPGKYTLKVVAKGGASKSMPIVIQANKTVSKQLSFETGTLRIIVQPWADVWVNGQQVGQTPFAPIKLLEGSHTIHLKNKDLKKDVDKVIVVRPNEETLLKLDWR
jgi:hypothetical protein